MNTSSKLLPDNNNNNNNNNSTMATEFEQKVLDKIQKEYIDGEIGWLLTIVQVYTKV
jgi:hypothetical protein